MPYSTLAHKGAQSPTPALIGLAGSLGGGRVGSEMEPKAMGTPVISSILSQPNLPSVIILNVSKQSLSVLRDISSLKTPATMTLTYCTV